MSLVSSFASVLGVKETAEPVTAAIAMLDANGMELPGSLQAFQYYPETISDTKAPEWVRKHVPGGSHPILTFLNGGERAITFTATFSQDDNPEPVGLIQGALTGSFDLSLSNLFGGERKDTVDIGAALRYLRSFTYPSYPQGVATPPPLALVYLPNSEITGNDTFPDSIVGAMVQCDITYEKMHRNGAPRLVAVQLSFVEMIQIGEEWKFIDRESVLGVDGSGEAILPQYKRELLGALPKMKAGGDAISTISNGSSFANFA